ncbi:uncharacterized protein LOC125704463 isoform X2 [Brienomyrus brachyistius]|uniref:uncharacterized protein LOC125704463 isoform X2 n=1 Tax=Brienomyrus brachyistius TaxID=42636 RepID=UPI0020B38633|nr:uncharacterized protein LOC125704463 isoform X2 [Brienomyrus brachyistius]
MGKRSSKPLEVAALGRPFQLGMLYDCRNDCLIPGITLWDHEDLQKNTDERNQHNTEFDIIASDSVEDKAWALDVDASLKVSFLGGLVEVGGSAKYLNDTKDSKKQARVTLKYKTTTKFMQLSMSHLRRGNVKHPYVFDQGIATHVVTAVLYGAQAFFIFDQEVSETEDQQNIKGNLQVTIKKIPKLSVEGEASLELTDTDRATAEKLSCKFYGDFALKQTPVSYQDAVKIYTTLPGLLGEKGENAVPVRVWLLPLEILDSSAARLVRQISVSLVNQAQRVIEDFNEIEMQCNDIMTRKVVSHFPEIGKKVKSFKDMCLEYKSVFQRSLSSILPSIRGGGTKKCVLANILTKKEQSPFNSNKLKEWLDCKEQEINLLQTYTDVMEDTKNLASKNELERELLKNRDKHVVCFAFTSLGEEEPYLSCLQSHLKALSTAKLTEPTEEDGKDVEPSEFYLSDAVSEKMKEQVFLFIDFAKANKENKKTHFISASIPNDKYKGASIYLYTDGMKQSDHFEPPSKPGRPNLSDVTHDSVTIKLNHPQYGSREITHYLVEYCANESDDWQFFEVSKSNLECTVSGLLPHTDYRVRYKAVCPAGVSLASEAESIKTLPTSPPGKAEEIDVDLEEIEVSWTKPDSIGRGVNIEDYVVEYRTETNENKADWEKKTSKGEVYKMTGLQPDTAYYIRITCNCGESGQSKESLTVSISTSSETTIVAEQIKRKSECLSQGVPSVYKVPLQEIPTNLDGCKRYAFGKKNIREHRTIMVIGANGAGKSTIINGMINYILGVKWEDDFRFKLIDEGTSKSQAESQTSLITAYEINYQEIYTIHNSITIIDTPGFGDTRGIERDREITEQIRTFFTSDIGISTIDAVCFVTQASLARLTPAQKYVFDSILSIFGKNIADNIQMLVTFADEQKPSVLEAINMSGVPCPKTEKGIPVHFKFNNSALFADNSTSVNMKNSTENFDKMFWRMGVKSMNKFFVTLTSMETKSLRLTKEALKERKELETAITGLQPQIRAGLAKLDEIKRTQQIIQEHEAEINTNKNFEFEVEVTKPVQVSIKGSGQYITNCQQCFVTCHYPCTISDDKDKAGCAAMNSKGNCRVCAGKCHWNVHFNQKYRWKYKKVKEMRTSEELKANYEKALGAKLTARDIINRQEEDIQRLQDEVLNLIETLRRSLARLKEIALKPNPLSAPEYIDLLIKSEKAEAKPGFLQRIQSLEAMKEQAVIIQKVSNNEELLPDEERKYKAKLERQENKTIWTSVFDFFMYPFRN